LRKDYQHSSTVSLWEILAKSDFFAFPNYQGRRMTILDACPTREVGKVHEAIRILLQKMNIALVEPGNARTKSSCCGDSFFGVIPIEKVKEQMVKRSSEMPLEDVVVYCVSCVKSMAIGGKKPHYLIDLMFGEETLPGTTEPEAWHRELDIYMEQH
jgi:Fe-S oxidoreductase